MTPDPTPSPTPQKRLPTITYKPGWTFTWGDTYEDGRVWLEIHVEGPDSKGWDRDTMMPRSVDFAFLVPTPFYPEWIRNRIAGIEDHEIREWLRLDGRLEFDPHV